MTDSEGASRGGLAHLRSDGAAHMVDVTAKEPTVREATAVARVVGLHGCEVDVELADGGVAIRATARTADRTGVEMEALTAVTVAALAVVDMVKGIDRSAVVAEAKIVAKSGGRSGSWVRPEG